MRLEGEAATQGSKMRVPNGLLAHLAQLPQELAHKIAADAFLSPKQASNIQISAQSLDALSRSELDSHEYSPRSPYSERGWYDDGFPSEDESM